MNLDKVLITTVVGSYPCSPAKESLMNSYYERKDPYLESLKRAVESQIDAGIELLTDGETRGGMIERLAFGLKGYRVKEKVEIISDISYDGEMTVEDAEKTRELIPDSTGLKATLTGPWTMVEGAENKHYDSKKEAVMDTASALKEEAEALEEYCDVIQIDEPYLSLEFPEYGKEAVEKITDIRTTTALHVCGDIGSIVQKIIEIDVDILDHEFAANPHLYEIFEDLSIDQRIAAGVITTEPEVEKIEEIKENINRAYDIFGPETMVDPDCGLKNLDEATAKKKLENMVIARNVVLNERNRKIRG